MDFGVLLTDEALPLPLAGAFGALGLDCFGRLGIFAILRAQGIVQVHFVS